MLLHAEKIKVHLARNAMSIKELVEKSNVSAKTIWEILNRNKNVRPCTAGKIANALKCNVEELLWGDFIGKIVITSRGC